MPRPGPARQRHEGGTDRKNTRGGRRAPAADAATRPPRRSTTPASRTRARGHGAARAEAGFRAGFVGVVVHPTCAVRRSQRLAGEDLCVTTSKAQTTRHRILGVVTADAYQLVLSDTPGILDGGLRAPERDGRGQGGGARRGCLLFVTDIFQDPERSGTPTRGWRSSCPRSGRPLWLR